MTLCNCPTASLLCLFVAQNPFPDRNPVIRFFDVEPPRISYLVITPVCLTQNHS